MMIPAADTWINIPDEEENIYQTRRKRNISTRNPAISTAEYGLSGCIYPTTYDALSACSYHIEHNPNDRRMACCKCEYCASMNVIKEDRVNCTKCGAALNFQEIEYIWI